MDNGLKIINFLGKHYLEEYTMHELSKVLNIPYASFYRYAEKNETQGILYAKKIGKSKVLKLNLNHPILKSYLANSSFDESQDFLKKHPIIKRVANELKTEDVVLLFGSYAKGKQTEKSDIDILIVNNKGNKTISFSKHELLYKKKINPIFITKKEFKEMLKDKEENVGKQVLKDHIALNGFEEFWECVLNVIR